MQIKSVKQLKRVIHVHSLEGKFSFNEEHLIPSAIFANKSQSASNTVGYLKKVVSDGILNSSEVPDMIVCMDNGIIFHSMRIENTIFCNLIKEQSKLLHMGEKYVYLETKDEVTLAMFLFLLQCVTPPEPLLFNFITYRYLQIIISQTSLTFIEP